MKKILAISVILLFGITAFSQTNIFSAGVCHTAAAPAFNPGARGCRLVLDTTSQTFYVWKIGTTWVSLGRGIDEISGCAAPAYTPNKWQSYVVINKCTPNPELYYYFSGTWHLNGGGGGGGATYTAGTGIAISGGNVISNTGDLSTTNELQNLSLAGQALAISSGTGVTLPIVGATAADFDLAGGVLSLDYTNAQKATALVPGFLTAADWVNFNSKLSAEVDGSTTNEIQTLSIAGQNLTLSLGGGTVVIPGGGGGASGLDATLAIGNETWRKIIQDTIVAHPLDLQGTAFPFIEINAQDTVNKNNANGGGVWKLGTSTNGGFAHTNHVMYMGWNIEPGGGASFPGRPGIGEGWEQRWRPYSSGIDYTEKHEVWIKKTGEAVRIGSYTCNNDAGEAQLYHTVGTFGLRRVHQDSADYFLAQGTYSASQIGLRNSRGLLDISFSNVLNSQKLAFSNQATAASGDEISFANFGAMRAPSSLSLIGRTGEVGSGISFYNESTPGAVFSYVPTETRLNTNNTDFVIQRGSNLTFFYPGYTNFQEEINIGNTAANDASLRIFNQTKDYALAAVSQRTGLGYHAAASISASGASTQNVGLEIGATGGTSINKGIWIFNPPAGANNWGLYCDAAAQNYFNGKVGIGTSTPVASAKLEISSTESGFLPPRMTTTQRDAIASPAQGLHIENLTTNTYQRWNGTAWEDIAGTPYTDEAAQDAVGAMAGQTLTYVDATPLLDVKTQMSVTSDASGVKLSGDVASPGNTQLYGTNGSGVKGWYAQPSGGGGSPGGSNGQIQYNSSGAFAGGPQWDAVNNRIGVNEASPTYHLHIKGNSPGNNPFMGFFGSTGVQAAAFDTDGSGNGAFFVYDGAGVIHSGMNANGASGTLGSFGIGTIGPAVAFDMRGRQANIGIVPIQIGSSGGGYPAFGYNINYTTSNNLYNYRSSGETTFLQEWGSSTGNNIDFSYAPNGTAGNPITFTKLLSLVNTGRVGIGQSSPTAALHIKAGTATASTAPLKLTTGTNLTTAESGAVEYNNSYYATKNSGLRFGIGGIIFKSSTTVPNVTTTETDLYSHTLPASTLATDNESVEAMFSVSTLGSATASTQNRLYFGGTLIYDSGALSLSVSSDFRYTVEIIRESATVVKVSVTGATTGATAAAYTVYTRITGLTLSNTQILKLTGTRSGVGAASADINGTMSTVKWFPSAG